LRGRLELYLRLITYFEIGKRLSEYACSAFNEFSYGCKEIPGQAWDSQTKDSLQENRKSIALVQTGNQIN